MDIRLCSYGHSPANEYALTALRELGYTISDTMDDQCTHLLLPTPSFNDEGVVRGGRDINHIIKQFPDGLTIIGGKLNHPALSKFAKIDLLEDSQYLAQNAAITAHCALKIALENIPSIITQQEILILGWGRIGKCLARLLKSMDCQVTVATRKETDRAVLSALGYRTIDTKIIDKTYYGIIFNTVPTIILTDCGKDVLVIELASKPGVTGDRIINARGLPGKEAPESSGKLIAQSIHRILQGKECFK